MGSKHINLTLRVWRQKNKTAEGSFVDYQAKNVSTDASFLEMLDAVNEELVTQGHETISFDHDCREGICGSCGFVIDGEAHGRLKGTTVCQLHMRNFNDGETLTLEPFRAKAFPVIKDLMVDRTAFDRIIAAGGFISTNNGNAVDANAILVPKPNADEAMSSATCIGCGACVAACKNASAALFTSAKISHMTLLPQGQVERKERATKMVAAMDAEGFGSCTTTGACEAACPKEIQLTNISRMNREFFVAKATERPKQKDQGAG
jgi:succinate dehydrogenase / fumarate reductase iron-sulfur subunit